MIERSSPLLLVLGLLGAATSPGLFTGCKGDGVDGSRSGRVSTSARSSRVPQRVVGEAFTFAGSDKNVSGGDPYTLRRIRTDAGVIQVDPLKDGEQLELDAIATRESVGILLAVEWKLSDLPAPSGAPETAVEGLEEARNKTRLRMRVEVAAAGRLRVTFLGQGYPWSEGTELRARADKFGHVLVWPDGKSYRNVVPGALRALFTDRRLDQGPLFTPKVTTLVAGQSLELSTERRILSTPVGELQLDQATVPVAGLGAPLLCRMLVELAGIEPDCHLCRADQLPLHAQFTNAPRGKLTFAVTHLGKKQDLPVSYIQVPPELAVFQSSGMPLVPGGSVERSLLSALRHRAVMPPTPPAPSALPTPANATVPAAPPNTGLVAVNRGLSLRALLVDGITVAWLAPGMELALPELRNGLYSIAWRDFFGSHLEPPRNVALPARVTLGNPSDTRN